MHTLTHTYTNPRRLSISVDRRIFTNHSPDSKAFDVDAAVVALLWMAFSTVGNVSSCIESSVGRLKDSCRTWCLLIVRREAFVLSGQSSDCHGAVSIKRKFSAVSVNRMHYGGCNRQMCFKSDVLFVCYLYHIRIEMFLQWKILAKYIFLK